MQTYQRLRVTVVSHLDHAIRMLVEVAHDNGIGESLAVGWRLRRRRRLTAKILCCRHCWIASRKSNGGVETVLRDGYGSEEEKKKSGLKWRDNWEGSAAFEELRFP